MITTYKTSIKTNKQNRLRRDIWNVDSNGGCARTLPKPRKRKCEQSTQSGKKAPAISEKKCIIATRGKIIIYSKYTKELCESEKYGKWTEECSDSSKITKERVSNQNTCGKKMTGIEPPRSQTEKHVKRVLTGESQARRSANGSATDSQALGIPWKHAEPFTTTTQNVTVSSQTCNSA